MPTPPSTKNERDLLTVQQAAEYLGIHHQTVRKYVTAGRLPATRPGGWSIRIHRTALEKFAATPHEASA